MGIYPGVLWPVSATSLCAEMPIGDNQRFVPASGKDGISPGLNIRDLIHSLNEYQDGRHGRGHPVGGHPPERPLHYPGICRRQLRRSDKRARVGAVTLNDQSRPTTQARQAGGCLPQQVQGRGLRTAVVFPACFYMPNLAPLCMVWGGVISNEGITAKTRRRGNRNDPGNLRPWGFPQPFPYRMQTATRAGRLFCGAGVIPFLPGAFA